MRKHIRWAITACLLLTCISARGIAANKETIDTVEAYVGESGVRVDVFCHNEVGLLEYFNLIVFDDTRLEYVGIEADRGGLWYGTYPTHVDGNHIYVHGVASAPAYCMDPDWGEPGSPLYHIVFKVKAGAPAGPAAVSFATEGAWDGHWNDCSGYAITPNPDYYDGAVDIIGHAASITIGSDSTTAGEQAVVDVSMHNDLDVFEYFQQIRFNSGIAGVDSIVALRGGLHYGYYPTHVSGDTIFVHGWAGDGECFIADHSYPGAALYRIYFTVREWAPPGYTMPLAYLDGGPVWNHWVGCDLYTTDSFEATDGSVHVLNPTGVEVQAPVPAGTRIGAVTPNPTARGAVVSYYLVEPDYVTVTVYNAAGKRIKTMEKRHRRDGWHRVRWDGIDAFGETVSSGVYFIRLQTRSATFSRKLVVVR
jgi:hypothetical protein